MSNPAPITLQALFKYYKGEPHQIAALVMLEEDLKANGYDITMRRDRPWFATWSQSGRQPDPAPQSGLKALLDLIAAGEGGYTSSNRGRAGDTPGGTPGLDTLTIGQVKALQARGVFAVGRYQFTPETLKIAVADALFGDNAIFNADTQDKLAIALLLGTKRPILRDYLLGKNVSIEAAQLDLAKEWASIPTAEGRGFYDGDSAGNKASAEVKQVQAALRAARATVSGGTPPKLTTPAQQKEPNKLRLIRTGQIDPRGLEILSLRRFKDGIPMGALNVVSGVKSAQHFRKGPDSKSGSLEPLPQGNWRIEDIAWASGRKDDYSGSWGSGLGPASIPLTWQGPGPTERSAIEMHYDANKATSAGTAGCVGFNSIEDLKTCIAWLRADNPRLLEVDWGLK